MNEEFVVVWRAVEGAAVQTFAHPDKKPRVFKDTAAPEAADAPWVDEKGLGALLEKRETFEPKRVGKSTAKELLGWSV